MSIGAALAGGFLGTLVLTTAMSGATQLRLTRMDAPFLLGTAFTADRTKAKVLGYLLHFLAGLLFSLAYYALFVVVGHAGWLLGMALGLLHALFAGSVLVNVVLPAIHPRMGTTFTAANAAPLLEPPGFMLLNYGRATPVVMVLAHLAYGAIVGAVVAAAA